MRGFFVIPVLMAQFSCAAALAQVPTNPVQSADRLQVANCVRQGLAASPACIGLVAVPCVSAACE